jgi:PKD repeat protein
LTAGNYAVKLTVSNADGTDSEIKTNYIIVSSLLTGECYGAEACNPTGSPIGGGAGYKNIVLPTDPRIAYTVTTVTQLRTALSSATAGQVVFIPSTANIDISGQSSFTIPGGVILAGDRGNAGSPGGRIYRTRTGTFPLASFMAGGNNVRITGLRIEGADSVQGQDLGDDVKAAIMATNKDNLEVDNCEIYYWSYGGVVFENDGPGNWYGYVHHNYIHHVHAKGYGYATAVVFGNVLIEANLFDYTRHAVTGYGGQGEKYEVRYNIHGSHCIDTVFDVHAEGTWSGGGLSGQLYKIHHNTVTYSGDYALDLIGTPSEGMYINNNRFETGVLSRGGMTRVFMTNNYIGNDIYPTGPVN